MKDPHRFYRTLTHLKQGDLVIYTLIPAIVLISDLLWFNFKLPINNGNNPFYSLNSSYILKMILYPVDIHNWPGSLNPVAFSNYPGVLFSGTIYSFTGNNYPLTVFLLGYIWQLIGAYVIYYVSGLFLDWENLDKRYSIFAVFLYLFNESLIQSNPFLSNMPLIITFVLISYLALFRNKRFILLLGFYSFFTTGDFPYLTIQLMEIFIVLIFIGFLVLIIEHRDNLKSLRKRAKELSLRSILSIPIILLSVSFLLFPFLSVLHTYYSALITPTPTYAFGFWTDANLKLQNAVRLINNWAYFTPFYAPPWYAQYINNQVIAALLWIFPLMALGSILFIGKKISRLFYIIMVVVIFFSKANNPPFGSVFVWLIYHVPLLRPYYNGSYFEPFQLALYLIFSSIFIAGLLKMVNKNRKFRISTKKIISVVLIVVILSSSLVSVYPIIYQSYSTNNPLTPQYSSLPAYYNEVSDYLYYKNPNAPVMVFPDPGQWSALSNGGKIFYYGGNPYYDLISNPVVAGTFSSGYVSGRGLSFPAIKYIYSLYPGQPTISGASFGDLSNIINYSKVWNNYYGTYNISNSSLQLIYNTSVYRPYGAVVTGSIINMNPFDDNRYMYVNVSNTSINATEFKIGIENDGFLKYYGLSFLCNTSKSAVYYFNLSSPRFVFDNSSFTDHQIQIFYMYNQNETSPSPVSASLAFAFNNGTNSTTYSFFMANLLSDLGVKYAYVDSALNDTGTIMNASSYNELFSSSKYFRQVIHIGTVTVYEDVLYNGVVSTFQIDRGTYLNETLMSDGEEMIATGGIVEGNALNVTQVNPVEYEIQLQKGSTQQLIVLKTQFNGNYELFVNGESLDKSHHVAFGYSNYWVVPENATKVLIVLNNSNQYSLIEAMAILIPFIFGILFIVFEIRNRMKKVVNEK
jgi:hypothetical protein